MQVTSKNYHIPVIFKWFKSVLEPDALQLLIYENIFEIT